MEDQIKHIKGGDTSYYVDEDKTSLVEVEDGEDGEDGEDEDEDIEDPDYYVLDQLVDNKDGLSIKIVSLNFLSNF
jgi:hypothetical protein